VSKTTHGKVTVHADTSSILAEFGKC